MIIKFQIQNGQDRERVVLGLANSGYRVAVTTEPNTSWSIDYFVNVELVDVSVILDTLPCSNLVPLGK